MHSAPAGTEIMMSFWVCSGSRLPSLGRGVGFPRQPQRLDDARHVFIHQLSFLPLVWAAHKTSPREMSPELDAWHLDHVGGEEELRTRLRVFCSDLGREADSEGRDLIRED